MGDERNERRGEAVSDKRIVEANGVKYLVTETYGKTRSGKSIRSCKWETYTEEMKLF